MGHALLTIQLPALGLIVPFASTANHEIIRGVCRFLLVDHKSRAIVASDELERDMYPAGLSQLRKVFRLVDPELSDAEAYDEA